MNDSKDKTLKILIGVIVAVTVFFAGFAAFIVISRNAQNSAVSDGNKKKDKTEATGDDNSEEKTEVEDVVTSLRLADGRPSLLSDKVTLYNPEINASVAKYTVNRDFSNVDNKDLYYFDEEEMRRLSENYFMVAPYGGYEFFEVYESNRYDYQSSFVTVDSLMHTYHLYFAHLLKNLEKNELSDAVANMSLALLQESNAQYDELKGTEWEEAAKRNVAFFAIGTALQGGSYNTSVNVSDIVDSEVSKINAAQSVDKCVLTDQYEDYSQYKPRGYYENDPKLEAYFKTMMWYGRIQLNAKDDEMIKSSVLMNMALSKAGTAEWKDVYDITTFFAGASDDLGYYEYYPLIQEIYGENASISDIASDEKSFSKFKREVANLRLPEINSIPIEMGDDNVIPGFRLMGQRFSIDAAIMQQLIYQNVDANPQGDFRMLPNALDVPAAFGSDIALEILEEQGETEYKGYMENMNALRDRLSTTTTDMALRSNLSGMWIDTLRPLLIEKGEGFPVFMQSKEWAKRDLECFEGSYTELKHDTILYAKQAIAEMGGGEIPEYDDRGYVQPEPVIYAKFAYLAEATRTGLEERGRINQKDSENLKKLEEIAKQFITMSEKELRDEVLTDAEYDFIREYGGALEHFWYDVMSEDTGKEYINTEEYKAALVVDVATDPNGQVLELGLGNPSTIYVMVNVDGKVKVARGSVYSFYQFTWPLSDRLTDSSWREMMGIDPLEDGYYYNFNEPMIDPPEWTQSYRYQRRW